MDSAGRPQWDVLDSEIFRQQVRAWIGDHWHADLTLREWWRALAEAGLTVPTWPRAFGGLATTTFNQQIIEDELSAARAVAPPLADDSIRVVGPALREHCTHDQADRYIPTMIDGSQPWALLFAERDDDSLAFVHSTATIDWKYTTLAGRKLLPPRDQHASWGLALCRSEHGSTGRDGLTCVPVDLTTATVDGDVVVLDGITMLNEERIGQQGQGWLVAKSAIPYVKRSLAGRIRRGVVLTRSGERGGNLQRTVGEIIASSPPPRAPDADRRGG
jgi:alkylation response protein AidB-like acyl-CoA dehydrogenase